MSTKKAPVTKSKSKVVTKRKAATKTALAKTVRTRKAAVTKKTVSTKKSELDKMIAKIDEARKNGEKSVVVYTTSKSSHKANAGFQSGFGASDLKPSLLSAYKHLLVEYDLTTNLVNMSDMAVEWVVRIKK